MASPLDFDLPAGFTLDDEPGSSSAAPELPDGFTLDPWEPPTGKSGWPDPAKTGLLPEAPEPSPQPSIPAPDKRQPASIRYANPGAMYPGPSSQKFGATATETIGGGHKIAVFPDKESGAAAQFDLLSRGYTGMPLGDAIRKWSGGNNADAYTRAVSQATGLAPDTVLTADMIRNPSVAIPLAKAMARVEAGVDFPMSDEEWQRAHARAFGAPVQTASAPRTETPAQAPRDSSDLLRSVMGAPPEQRRHIVEDYLYRTLGVPKPRRQELPEGFKLDAQQGAGLPPGFTLDEAAESDAPETEQQRGDGFVEGLTDPQQYLELGKGVIPGAVRFGGTILQAPDVVAARGQHNAAAFGRQQIAVMDRIDRGETVPETEDALGYQHMTPEQRQAIRAEMEKAQAEFSPTPIQERPFFRAGEAVQEFAEGIAPAAPGYEDSVGRQLGEGLGSMVAGLPFGLVGKLPAAAAFGAAGIGEATQRAIEFDREERKAGRPGLTQDQIIVAGLYGAGPGTTDLLPLETLLGRIPVPIPDALKRPLLRAIARIGGQAFIEGVQEGGQEFLQNLIAREVYDPSQELIEGVGHGAGVGAGVGAIAQTAKELGGWIIKSVGARRARKADDKQDKAEPSPATETPAEQPAAAEQEPSQQEAEPEDGEPSQPPPASAEEAAILRAQGWTDEQIADMDPAERAEEIASARAQGVAPLAPDLPTAEPSSDLVAQARDLVDPQNTRRALYVPRSSLEALLNDPDGANALAATLEGKAVSVDDFDGQGGMLVVPDDETAQWAVEQKASGRNLQEIIGELTGAGRGKPVDGTTVVQQVTPDGDVTRESLVTEDQVAATEDAFKSPGRDVRTVTPEEALRRREDEIAAQTAQPAQPTEPIGDGSRQKPVKVQAPEDVDRAAERVQEPTEAQAEVGNYRHGHAEFQGLQISIETPKGAIRRGRDWEVVSPAAYGYFKGVKARAKDKEHVDVYVGDAVQSDLAFVVDQYDLKTGRYDEPKVILGAGSQEAALAIYDAGFSDGKGPQRRRRRPATEVSLDELRDWLDSGDATKPFARQKVREARRDASARVRGLAEHGGPVPEPQQPVLSQLRRPGDQTGPELGDELRGVPEGRRPETRPQDDTGPDRQQQRVRTGERALGDEEGASAQHAQEPATDVERQDADADSVGRGDRSRSIDAPVSSETGGDDSRAGANNAASSRKKTDQVNPPTFAEVMDALPKDESGDPDVAMLANTIREITPKPVPEAEPEPAKQEDEKAPETGPSDFARPTSDRLASAEVIARARELGRAAFEMGQSRVPTAHQEMMDLLADQSAADAVEAMDAFTRAWDEANSAAPTKVEPASAKKPSSRLGMSLETMPQQDKGKVKAAVDRVRGEQEPAAPEPAPEADAKPAAPELSDDERVLGQAILDNFPGHGNRLMFTRLRAAVPSLSKQEFDKAILSLQRKGLAVIYRIDNQVEVTDADREAAVMIGTQPRHFVYGDAAQQSALRAALQDAERQTEPAEPQQQTESAEPADIVTAVRDQFFGDGFRTITEARKFVRDRGFDGSNKEIDELIETAVVAAARTIIEGRRRVGGKPKQVYDSLVRIYERQPTLGTRTSTSVANQAYSTPVPLAYIASRLAGVATADVVYEPTAGNGALLIEAGPNNDAVHANERDPTRAKELERQGFTVTTEDAAERAHIGQPADAVIMNPPFGAVREGGKSKEWTIDGWTTSQVDHAIALQSLKAMTDDGRAVLILGGVKADTIEERRKGYRGKAKREFYFRLYNQYNVTDHFTVDGDLYTKQGASWPVDVVVIEGRGKSARALPAAQPPTIFKDWDSLAEKLPDATATARPDTTEAGRPVAPADRPAGEVGRAPGRDEERGAKAVRGGSERVLPESRDDAVRVRGERDRGESGDVRGGRRDELPAVSRPDPDTRRADKPATAERVRPRVRREGGQATYEPASRSKPLDTLIPVNMADAAAAAMRRVEQRRGSVDAFVAERLGYDPKDLSKYFGAEQIDAIAAAIDNIERGSALILGDQTGIGKGRQVAATLRYAMRQGKIPVFVTEKPDLYGDMWRDMRDIGLPEMLGREPRIFMTNTGASVTLDEEALAWKQEADAAREAGQPIPKRRGKFLTGGTAARQAADMDAIASGKGGYDVVFTTYDQLNTVKGQTTPRRKFLAQIAKNALIVFDESHNSGGAGQGGWKSKNAEANRAEFARQLAADAWGVMFSSATYAKRPDVMDLYARTDMGQAVDDPKMLPELIARGGVPMQQIVATMLADSGQYIRRERSFDGVEYAVEGVPVNPESYRQFSDAIRAVFRFDLAVTGTREEIIKDALDGIGAASARDSGVGKAAASTTAFASVMHNLVNQMLLSIKAGQVAKRAIAAVKDGEKPVIGLASTMESFISDFAASEGISVGETLDLSFRDMLTRYLRRTLRVTIKHPDGKKEHMEIPVASLSAPLQRMYRDALDTINEGDYEGLPISPIDAIRHELTKAGLKVAEVTGRQTMIDYSESPPRYVARPKREIGPSGKRQSIAAFNRGALDVLILNRSGSTGVSMHASASFRDKRRRRMILAQAEGNIDTHLQMLGRVHRTGQVVPPAYSQIAAEIPAEARPTAVLMKKMASLNANTTGARGSVFMSDAVDFINEVGNKVVANILEEDPDLNALLGSPLKTDNDGRPIPEDAAKRVTGRLTLLTPEQQTELLDRITSAYKAEIEQLDALGENPLEAKTLDLQARTLESTEVKPRQGDSPFLEAVALEKVSVKAQGRAMAPDEVARRVAETLKTEKPGTDPASSLGALERQGQAWGRETWRKIGDRARDWIAREVAQVSGNAKATTEARHQEALARWRATLEVAYPGARVRLGMPAGDISGIVLKVERTGKAKNPVALGSWEVRIAVPDSDREYIFPMSKLFPAGFVKGEDEKGATIERDDTSFADLVTRFEEARREGRETRFIFTGNILAAYDQTGGRGRIVNFTTESGELRPGILMGREFSQEKFMETRKVRFQTGAQVAQFLARVPEAEIKSIDELVTLRLERDGLAVMTPAARATGGRIYTDSNVRRAVGVEFVRSGKQMVARGIPSGRTAQIVDAMRDLGAIFETQESQDVAQEIIAGASAGQRAGGTLRALIDVSEDSRVGRSVRRDPIDRIKARMLLRQPVDLSEEAETALSVLRAEAPPVPGLIRETVVSAIKPRKGHSNQFIVTVRDTEGNEYDTIDTRDDILRSAGLFDFLPDGTPIIVFYPFDLRGDFVQRLRGERAHEWLHGLRVLGHLPGRVEDAASPWGRLVRHADSLGVMQGTLYGHLKEIGHPRAENIRNKDATIFETYHRAYGSRSDYPEAMGQESVAHMVQQYVHGVLTEQDIAPVRDILTGMMSPRSGVTELAAGDELFRLTGQHDPSFTPRFEQSRTEIAQRLVREFERMVPSHVRVVVRNRIERDGFGLNGYFSGRRGILAIALAYGPEQALETGKHEVVHAARYFDLFTDREWRLLVDHARKTLVGKSVTLSDQDGQDLWAIPFYRKLFEDRFRKRGLEGSALEAEVRELLDQELVANMAERWAMGDERYTGRIDKLLKKLANFLEALRNALRGAGFQTVDDVFQRLFRGEIAARAGMARDVSEGPMFSLASAPTGSELDMSPEARKARAEAMGFDTSTVLYHGTRAEFEAFSKEFWGENTGARARSAFFFSTDPAFASGYAEGEAPGGRVLPVYARLRNPLRLSYAEHGIDDIIKSDAQIASLLERARNMFSRIRGVDGLVLESIGGRVGNDIYAIFDPANIRSVNAEFDPAKEGSPVLLASAIPQLAPETRRTLARDLTEAINIVSRIAGKEVEVRFFDQIPAEIAAGQAQREATAQIGVTARTAGGFYQRTRVDGQALIGLATNDPSYDLRTTAGHEAWHHVEEDLATDAERRLLRAPSEMARTARLAAQEIGRSVEEVQQLPDYEIRAIAFQRYRRMREEGAQLAGIHIGVRRLWDRIIRIFQAVRNVVAGNVSLREALAGAGSTEAIFERARRGEMAARPVRTSEAPDTFASTSPNAERARSSSDSLTGTKINVPRSLAQWLGIPHANFQANYAEIARKRAINPSPGIDLSDPIRVREFVEDVLTRAEFAVRTDPNSPGQWNLVVRDDVDRAVGVRLVKRGHLYNVSTALVYEPHQLQARLLGAARVYGLDGVRWKNPEAASTILQLIRAGVGFPIGSSALPEGMAQGLIDPSTQEVMDALAESQAQGAPDTQANIIPTNIEPQLTPQAVIRRGVRRTLSRAMNAVDRARVLAQDKVLLIRRYQEKLEKDTGLKLPANLDVYLAEALFHGRAGERLQDLRAKFIEPLIEKMRAADIKADELGDYLYARHAEERNRKIREIDPNNEAGSGMPNKEAAEILGRVQRSGKQAQYDELAAMVDEMLEETRGVLLRAGLIDRETYDNWKSTYQHYVPLRGFEVEDEDGSTFPRVGRGFDVRGPEAFRSLGRRSKADNPVLYAVQQAQQAIIRAEKNRVDKTLYRQIQANPDPSIWRIYKGEYKRRVNPQTGLVEKYWVPPAFVRSDNIVGVKIGGKQHWIEIKHPGLLRAIRGVGSEIQGTVLGRVLFKAARTYAGLLTSYNPEFLFSNFFRDIETALINVSDIAEKPEGTRRRIVRDALSAKAIRGAFQALRGDVSSEYARWFEEFRLAGGKISFMEYNDIDRIRKDITRSLTRGRTMRAIMQAGRLVEDLNTAVENGVRLSVYKALRENGVSQDRAAFVARELTVNFNRKGEWGPTINALYLFFNASVQGTTRIAQAFARSKAVRWAVGSIFATGLALDLINYLVAGDDDDGENAYDKIPEWVKERNLIIMIPGDPNHGYVQIPLAYGYNVPFLAGQKAMSVIRGAEKPLHAAATVAAAARDAFNPMGSATSFAQFVAPTFLDPVVQVLENKTWYGGPIFPQHKPKHQPWSETYQSSTPDWAVEVARIMNQVTGGNAARSGLVDISPDVLAHYLEFATGGVGKFVLNAINSGERIVSGDEWLPEKTPFIRRLYGKSTTVSRYREFYDAWDEVDAAFYEVKELAKDGDRAGSQAARQQYRAELSAYPAMKSTEKALRDMRKMRDRIEADPTLSADEKRRRLEELQKRANQMIIRALGTYAKARQDAERAPAAEQ